MGRRRKDFGRCLHAGGETITQDDASLESFEEYMEKSSSARNMSRFCGCFGEGQT